MKLELGFDPLGKALHSCILDIGFGVFLMCKPLPMEPVFSLPECFLAPVSTEASCYITEVSSALQQSPRIHDNILALLSSTSLHYRRLKDRTYMCIPSDMLIFVVFKIG